MTHETPAHKIAEFMERRSGWLVLAVVAATALLVIPMVALAPEETASDNPGGLVYELEDKVNSQLPPRFHGTFYLVEARDGDMLTQAPLWELYQNIEKLRQVDAEGKLNPDDLEEQPYLFSGYDVDRQQPVVGVFTVADVVQEALVAMGTSLESASDDQVKLALSFALIDPRTEAMSNFIYRRQVEPGQQVLGQQIDYWRSPALGLFVAADNAKLGGGSQSIGTTGDPVTRGKEQFSRKVQAVLRGDEQSYQLWGVAIDAGLEIEDEVGTAVPFIVATFVVVLIVVGISLRSWRSVLLTAIGLAMMIVWLKGLSNLVGLKSSTVLDFIVPIAMISLGADFVIHAVNRYREERRIGLAPRPAFRLGMAGVLGALALAMVTDAMAFLSNVSANIETVIEFGIGAGLAIAAAFVIMGIAVPLALMRWDAWRVRRASRVEKPAAAPPATEASQADGWLVALVVGLARQRLVVLPVTAVITAVAVFYAMKLEGTFDVKDFFKSDSDFVVGLDKLEEHVGEEGGESAIIYVQGDLTDPKSLLAINEFLARAADNEYVAKNDHGEASLQARPIFFVLDQVVRSEYTRAQIEEATGVTISTDEGLTEFQYQGRSYLWPDSRRELKAIFDYVSVNGVYESADQKIYDHLEVRETVFHDPSGAWEDATAIVLGVPGTRDQEKTIGSRDTLTDDLGVLDAAPSISQAGLTGSPYTRQAALDATTLGLQRALPIAVVACLMVAIAAMRSIRFGVVTIIPIGLVVAWLYAFMYVFDFGLNFITATIAAISIGVGVDYAIHMTQRFREELGRSPDQIQALRSAAQGTGVALVASAATSVLGFAIMAFAPMPMFSSYGVLTAIMIFMAAVASLLVLPSLLLLVTPAEAVAEAVEPATGNGVV